ncbi:hypothetical protein C8F04DRAFT_712474 [Mycena alexandri]|uniref:Uncharacterized protein n=1 Tax=Mycena alexandri TaxID=1745969 RepID=A0AAD6X039_9AGAR|nr:hypothetical protein C8F04DRAFT_712474 [Mycena alexandri]
MRSSRPLAALRPPRASCAPLRTACGARLLHRVPTGARDGPACGASRPLRAPLSSPSSSFTRASRSPHPPSPPLVIPTPVGLYTPPHPNQACRVCSISAHVEGCRLSVLSAECARMCNLSSSFSRAFASRPLIYPPASLVPVVSSPSYTTPHPNQAGPRTWRGCRSRVCALPAHADDGAERMCGGVVRGPRASLLARARCWADTAALLCCVRAPPISSPVPSHPMPPALYPRPLESRIYTRDVGAVSRCTYGFLE